MEKMGRRVRELMVDEVAKLIEGSPYFLFVSFRKTPVLKAEALRRSLKKSASSIKVIKSSILRLALKKRNLNPLCDLIEGNCALTFGKDDPVRTSKILCDFSKTDEGFNVRGGYIYGEIFFENRIKELAALPTREALLARVVGDIKSPINGFANVLRGNLQKLVYIFDAISKKGGQDDRT